MKVSVGINPPNHLILHALANNKMTTAKFTPGHWMERRINSIRIMVTTMPKRVLKERVVSLKWKSRNNLRTKELSWNVIPFENAGVKGWWVVTPYWNGMEKGTLRLVTRSAYDSIDGYFVAAGVNVATNNSIQKISGCAQVRIGIPYAQNAGTGMVVRPMEHPDKGFHGWCYVNHMPSNTSKYGPYTHYFSVSTAPSWLSVAEWYNTKFKHVESDRFNQIAPIVEKLKLKSILVDDRKKIFKIRNWMHNHLKYTTVYANPQIPNNFDTVINHNGGDCDDLVLVMTMLLNTAGIDAHPALTSTTSWHLFGRLNSASLNSLNHIVVYIPRYKLFIDPTAAGPSDASYLAEQQVLDTVTGKVLAPTKKEIVQ